MGEVEIRSVPKRFGSTEVLKKLDLKVKSVQVCALLGQSGCGKSTLLRVIADGTVSEDI
jgi:ABC-type sugar transport system ATPase subunit